MSGMLCFVCQSPGDNIASDCREVYLEDDGHKAVYVGPTCFQRVEKAGSAGVISGKGRGPRVFSTFNQAAAYFSEANKGRFLHIYDDLKRARKLAKRRY